MSDRPMRKGWTAATKIKYSERFFAKWHLVAQARKRYPEEWVAKAILLDGEDACLAVAHIAADEPSAQLAAEQALAKLCRDTLAELTAAGEE